MHGKYAVEKSVYLEPFD